MWCGREMYVWLVGVWVNLMNTIWSGLIMTNIIAASSFNSTGMNEIFAKKCDYNKLGNINLSCQTEEGEGSLNIQ